MAEVHVQSWQAAYKGLIPDAFLDNLSVDQRENGWRKTLDMPTINVSVIEEGNRIIAFVTFGSARDEGLQENLVGEVYAIYALQEFWNRGIGRKLMETAMKALRKMGYLTVKVWVLETNQRAITFYRKFGFAPDGAEKVEPREDFELKEVRYSLNLG